MGDPRANMLIHGIVGFCLQVVAAYLLVVVIINMLKQRAHTGVASPRQSFFAFAPSRNSPCTTTLNKFRVVAAPATGPRFFATLGFDIQFAENAIKSCGTVVDHTWLMGGSSAALRFTAIISSVIRGNTETILDAVHHFTEMTYRKGDSPATLSPMMAEMVNICSPTSILASIVHHPSLHLAVMVAHFHPRYIGYTDSQLKFMFVSCFLANIIHPGLLEHFFKRTCFYTGNAPPPFLTDDIELVPMTIDNFHQVLRATTCIPFVSERVTHIHGSPPGLFFDGALCDLQLNVQIKDPNFQMLYLADEPLPAAIKQTFFDIILPWRTAPPSFFDNCSIVAPTTHFINRVPIPSVSDWFNKAYMANPEMRKESWRAVTALSMKEWTSSLLCPEVATIHSLYKCV
jgi:hypothetical protein